MSAYAAASQFRTYVADTEAAANLDDAAIERLLVRAGRDVENYLGWPAPPLDVPRIDVLALTAYEAAALARAVCAQAEFRATEGEDERIGDTDYLPGELRVTRTAPRIGIKAEEELANVGLMRRSLTVAPDPEPLV